jgi:NTP pyrophosphatase (non-canonical NTP hydrolase)
MRDVIEKIIAFRDERDWAQFHNPKDLAIAVSSEAGELLELFLWKDSGEENKERVKEELADILIYCFLLAEKYGFDVGEIISQKIITNAKNYPVDKAKGTAKKYNEP